MFVDLPSRGWGSNLKASTEKPNNTVRSVSKMAAADSSRFGDPRSGYAQHPPHPSLPHPYAHHHQQQQQQHQSVVSAAAAVPAGIPQQSPAYPHPPQQQPQHSIPPHHHHQAPPPHPGPPTYGQLPPAAGASSQGGPHLDASSVAAVPNGRCE